MIIDNTYFEKDPIYISGIANRKDDKPTEKYRLDSANSYIAIYEPIFLRNLLGEALAATAEENPQIVALLRNEAVKTSPIANYVYFYWLRTHTTVGTPAGEKVQRGEYSDEARTQHWRTISCHRGLERYGAPMLRPAAEARRTGGRAGLLFGNFRTRKLIRIMIVKSTDTVRDIIIGRAALFNLESRRFAEEIRRRAEPECCVLHRRWLPDRRIAARDPKHMTMRDLAVLNATNRSTDYFVNVLSQMLGIPKEKVADLRFIRAYRYFLHCMDTLAAISKRFADLKIEPTDEERQAQIDRPDRGIAAVVRKYVQIMNGAVSPASVYGMEWSVVYEAFESTTNDVIEQRNLSRIQTSKIKRR